MGRFIVLLAAKTFMTMNPENCKFTIDNNELNIGDTEIHLRKISDPRDYNLSGLNYGWMIEVKLNEDNIDNAIIKAKEITEVFLSIFCLETGHPVYGSKIILSYEITQDFEKRIFRQYLNVTPIVKNADVELSSLTAHAGKIFDYKNLNTEGLNSDEITALDKNRKRVYRAIRWFRKGVIGTDSLDQFLSFWHGLESLNVVLAEYYGEENNTKLKEIGRKCENCGKGCTTFVPAGIEALYDDLNIDARLRKKISRTRIGLVHGTISIEELNNNALELLTTIAVILHLGISKILEITFKDSYENLERIHPIKIGELIGIQGFLKITDQSKIANDYYPHIFNHNINGIDNLQFNIDGYELIGLEHVSFGKNIKLDVEEKKISPK